MSYLWKMSCHRGPPSLPPAPEERKELQKLRNLRRKTQLPLPNNPTYIAGTNPVVLQTL